MQDFQHRVHKVLVGLALRCPHCERGLLFPGALNLFRMNETCPQCGVRFERASGESLGGMMINLVTAEIVTVGGWILTEILFDFPWVPVLAFWVVFNVLFCLLFYRHARAVWASISYLGGAVYADESETRDA